MALSRAGLVCAELSGTGQPGLNDKGLVTQDHKTKKDAYYFYKANWNPEPMIYLASRRSTPRTQPETRVEVFSNCEQVELKVNGQSLGKMTPDAVKVARWEKATLRDRVNKMRRLGS